MIPYYPGCLHLAGESAVRLNVDAVYSSDEEVQGAKSILKKEISNDRHSRGTALRLRCISAASLHSRLNKTERL